MGLQTPTGDDGCLAGRDIILVHQILCHEQLVGWPNGKALDYESRDCRFDPCVDQNRLPLS
jgi:hypothetical protein